MNAAQCKPDNTISKKKKNPQIPRFLLPRLAGHESKQPSHTPPKSKTNIQEKKPA
jgi:hypothetical protein